MKSFLFLLDAFRHDYLSEKTTPFLWKCAQEGEHYQRVIPSLGFCERSEILSGLTGAETGFFTAIGYDPDNSSYRNARGLALLHALERTAIPLLRCFGDAFASRAHGRLRGYVNRYFRSHGFAMTTHMIPFRLLEYFALTEDLVDHREPNVFPRPSILDQLTQAGRGYDYDSFTAVNGRFPYKSDEERLEAVPPKAGSNDADLFLIYVSAPDTYGHKYGPDSEGLRSALREMDRAIERVVSKIERQSAGNRYLFVGDHGMVAVTKKIDVEKELLAHFRRNHLKIGRDVVYFLDSTLARVWALNDCAIEAVSGALASSEIIRENGTMLDATTAKRLHVPWGDRRYGDHIWLADPGVMISPDFFHRISTEEGMHGYDPTIPESQGTCIYWGHEVPRRVEPSIPLSGVYGVLKRSLEL